MRSAVGSSWLYGIIIIFTLIFTGFLVMTLTYSKAYKLKNEMLTIIEKYEGLTTSSAKGDGSIPIINQYLRNSGYKGKGGCQDGDLAPESLESSTLVTTRSGVNYPYCISYSKTEKTSKTKFNVTVFFSFNLPVFRQISNNHVTGTTYAISKAYCLNNYC